MSLIFDAIRRSDQERRAIDEDSRLMYSPASEVPAAAKTPYAIGALVAIVIVLLLAVLWLLMGQSNDSAEARYGVEGVVARGDDTTITAIQAQQSASNTPEKSIEAEQHGAHWLSDVSAVQREHEVDSLAAGSSKAVAALYQNANLAATESAPAKEQTTKPVPAPALAPQAQTNQSVEVAPSDKPAPQSVTKLPPLLHELPSSLQREIPTLEYTRHVYDKSLDKRFVVLNDKTLKTGDEIVAGLKLELIADNFIVLNFHSRLFRLQALNSWINFQ